MGALDILLDVPIPAAPNPAGRAVASDSLEAALLVVRDRRAVVRDRADEDGRMVPLAVGEGRMSEVSGVDGVLDVGEAVCLARSAERMCLYRFCMGQWLLDPPELIFDRCIEICSR